MTGPEHFRKAEEILDELGQHAYSDGTEIGLAIQALDARHARNRRSDGARHRDSGRVPGVGQGCREQIIRRRLLSGPRPVAFGHVAHLRDPAHRRGHRCAGRTRRPEGQLMSAESSLTAVGVVRALLNEDTEGLVVLLPDDLDRHRDEVEAEARSAGGSGE